MSSLSSAPAHRSWARLVWSAAAGLLGRDDVAALGLVVIHGNGLAATVAHRIHAHVGQAARRMGRRAQR